MSLVWKKPAPTYILTRKKSTLKVLWMYNLLKGEFTQYLSVVIWLPPTCIVRISSHFLLGALSLKFWSLLFAQSFTVMHFLCIKVTVWLSLGHLCKKICLVIQSESRWKKCSLQHKLKWKNIYTRLTKRHCPYKASNLLQCV